jgi:hypothetical protein
MEIPDKGDDFAVSRDERIHQFLHLGSHLLLGLFKGGGPAPEGQLDDSFSPQGIGAFSGLDPPREFMDAPPFCQCPMRR